MTKKFNNNIRDGDKVRLNVSRIKAHPDYPVLTEKYKAFVGANKNTVFTVRLTEYQDLAELAESPEWLFHVSDLIKVHNAV